MAYHDIKPVYWLQSRFLEYLYFIFQHPFRLTIDTHPPPPTHHHPPAHPLSPTHPLHPPTHPIHFHPPPHPLSPTHPPHPLSPTHPPHPLSPTQPSHPLSPTHPPTPSTFTHPPTPSTFTHPPHPLSPTHPPHPLSPTHPPYPLSPTHPPHPLSPHPLSPHPLSPTHPIHFHPPTPIHFHPPTPSTFTHPTHFHPPIPHPPPPPNPHPTPTPYTTCCHVHSITYTVLDGFFPYLAQTITSMRGCVARNDLWSWPISSRSFSCDVAYFMDYIHLWHKYNPWGDDHFPVNISKGNATRAIWIFVVGARGILTLVDQDLQFLVMMTSSNGNIYRVTGPLCEEFTGHRRIPLTKASDAVLRYFLWSAPEQTVE